MPRLTSAVIIALAPCSIALAACAGPDTSGDAHLDGFPHLAAEADLRIGDADDPDVGFSEVYGVDVDRNGNVYVGEALVPEIRVYGPDGALLRRIGRRGAGPGEFERAPRFGVVGDTIWAVTYGPDRITLFDRDGTVLSARRSESVAVALPECYGYVVPWMLRPDGLFMSHLARIASCTDSPSGVQATDSIPVPFVVFDATGAAVDTLGWAARPPPEMWHSPMPEDRLKFIEIGGQRQWVPIPPMPLPFWEPLPDGYLLVAAPPAESPEDGTFTVTRFGLSGDTVYSWTVHYRPVRYSPTDLDSIAARGARGEAGGMLPFYGPGAPVPANWKRIARSLRDAMTFPEFKAPIEYPWLAQDESLWLRLRGEDDSAVRWAVLDARGRPRGIIELPASVQIQWSRDDTFWAVEPDENDVPWLVRFRILPG